MHLQQEDPFKNLIQFPCRSPYTVECRPKLLESSNSFANRTVKHSSTSAHILILIHSPPLFSTWKCGTFSFPSSNFYQKSEASTSLSVLLFSLWIEFFFRKEGIKNNQFSQLLTFFFHFENIFISISVELMNSYKFFIIRVASLHFAVFFSERSDSISNQHIF